MMLQVGDQPLFVELAERVFQHLQQMPAEQAHAVAATVNRALLTALPFQVPTTALLGMALCR